VQQSDGDGVRFANPGWKQTQKVRSWGSNLLAELLVPENPPEAPNAIGLAELAKIAGPGFNALPLPGSDLQPHTEG